MKMLLLLEVLAICATLTACGGGGNSSTALVPQGPPRLGSVSPSNVTLLAGNSQQFTASLTNGNVALVTWMVNGTVNNSPVLGTITSSGLYTAPAIPPLLEPIVISALTPGTSGPIVTAQVTVEFSNTSFSGQYVFTFDEVNNGSESRTVGAITADGNGNVVGTEDVNSPSGIFTNVPITGQYKLSADGQGTLTLNGGSAGILSMTFSLFSGANGGILADDATGHVGNGHLFLVTAAVSSVSSIQGNYLFNFGSGIFASSDNSAGLLDLSSGNIISGSLDENNSGSYVQDGTVTGSYTLTGGDSGTLNLTTGTQTSHFVFYAVSADQLELLDMDAGTLKSGELDLQTSMQGSLNASIFQLVGVGTGTTPDVLIATNALAVDSSGNGPCGNNPTFAIYENFNGDYKTTTGCFNYPGFFNGPTAITIATPFGNRNFVFYVQSLNPIDLLETSSGLGNVAGQVIGAQVGASVAGGQYVFSTTSQIPNSRTLSTLQGILQTDAAGNITGQAVLDANGVISTLPVNGKVTPLNTAGAGDAAGIYALTMNFGGGQTSSYFLAASSDGILSVMGTDATDVSSGSMIIQEKFTSQQ
ncbi:MAG: hypothetical protein ACYDAV_13005 [Gammaproteobacteria bacterium]